MITDLLKFTIKDGSAADAAELMKTAMEEDMGDDGCILAKAFKSKSNPNEIFVLLGWENQESIDKHLKTDHDRVFIEKLDPLLAGPPEFFDWEEIVT